MTIALALCFSATTRAQELVGKVEMKLTLEDSVFYAYQTIWPDVSLKNVSGGGLSIQDPAVGDNVTLELKDEQGNALNYWISHDIVGVIPDVHLDSNQTIYVALSTAGFKNTSYAFGTRLSPGKYTLQATGKNGLHSNIAKFAMKEIPVAEREVAKQMNATLWSHDADTVVASARKLIREYPGSIYLPEIYDRMHIFLYVSKNLTERSDSLMSSALQLIDRYPNSGWARTGVFDFMKGYDREVGLARNSKYSRDQARELKARLLAIKVGHQSARISRYVDEAIQRLERETVK